MSDVRIQISELSANHLISESWILTSDVSAVPIVTGTGGFPAIQHRLFGTTAVRATGSGDSARIQYAPGARDIRSSAAVGGHRAPRSGAPFRRSARRDRT